MNPPGGGRYPPPPQQQQPQRPMSFQQQSQQLRQQQPAPVMQQQPQQPQQPMMQQQPQQPMMQQQPQQPMMMQQQQPHQPMMQQQQQQPQQHQPQQQQPQQPMMQGQAMQQPQMISPPQMMQQPNPTMMMSPQQQHQQQQPMMTPQQQQQLQQAPQAQSMQRQPQPSEHDEQQQQQQQQQQQSSEEYSTATPAKHLKQKLKGLFHKDPQGPSFGFQPTAAMAQRHEDALIISKRPLFQFQVTKLRTWRTGYVRLLCLYDDHISTFDPDNSAKVTNTWNYDTLTDFLPVDKDQILLQIDKDKLKFQCHNVDRSRVLTALLQCQDEHESSSSSSSLSASSPMVLVNRWTRQGTQVPSAIRVTPYALVEVHPTSKRRIQTYPYVDIKAISFTSDDSTGLILHFQRKNTTRLFSMSKARSDVVTWMRQHYDRIGLELRMTDSCTVQQWKQDRQDQQHNRRIGDITVVATEWQVTKQSKRHDASIVGSSVGWAGGVVSRTLCLTGTGHLLEKDQAGMVVSSRSLSELYAIVRPSTVGDTVLLEYTDGQSRKYASSSRDSLLVSLLDAAATLGRNPKVQVSDVPCGGYCLASFAKSSVPEKAGGLFQPISIPLHCLKRVHNVATAAFSYLNSTTESSTQEGERANPIEECRNVMELCREFNASVLPTAEGLPTSEKDKFILGSIGSLWGLVAELLEMKTDRHLAEQTAAPIFQTLHRLNKTPAGYKNSIELATFVDCLPTLLWTIDDSFCKFCAFRALTVLLSGRPGDQRDKETEYVNKSVIFKAGGPRLIHGLVSSLLNQNVSDLIRMVMSDILQSVLCSYADTTGPEYFAGFIQALGEHYQALLNTLYQQTPFVIENSALLLHLLSTHAPSVAAAIRENALSSAVLLHHFHAAIFSPLEGQRFLSRFLCSLWLAGPMDCDEKKLLKRMVPRGFMGYLKMPLLSRVEEEQLDALERDAVEENISEDGEGGTTEAASSIGSSPSGAAGTNTARLRSRIALARATSARDHAPQQAAPENFRIFFHVLTQNHALPDLIWNQQARRELRIGLESEIQYIQRETDARGINQIAWNHQQFGIDYPSLENELRVGSVYMRLWLQAGEGFIKTWDEPLRLFELLFRRFLCEMDRNTKVTVMCIRCLERLYSIHGTAIGAFPDVMILIRSMASTRSIETQHRLLGLLATILGVQKDENGDENTINVPENAEQLLNTESIEQLCQFVAWGHTNGVQVGNLMTSVLGSGYTHSGRAMLTDGSETRPEGAGSNVEQQEVAPDASCPPVWFIASTGRIPPPAESIRGPFRVSELQRMMELGDLSPFTLVTSTHVDSYDDDEDETEGVGVKEDQIDTGKWKRLDQVWQLRWQLCTDGSGTGIYSPSEVALRAIRSLTRLVDLHKSLDCRGLPYYPIPIAKRIMCGLSRDPFKSGGGETTDHRDSFLSILSQSVLCNDPKVVDQAADLLFKLTQYNEEATAKFYLTGAYFFITCYTGSNFKSLAKLVHATHLKQHFRSGFAAAADNSELSLKERSILGSMLPEGVLFMLANYGVERFNEVFVGNFDTPEVIWNFEMRKHLIEMVRQHLGDFPKRLWQNTTTNYEYCPVPGVAYKRLEKEIFCHNYYLHNLCDESRFPDWPIAEPVEVFRACLEEFKKQVSRNETDEEEALESARKVLNLKAGDGSKELRKAYRSLARKYHPDKNPGGREMFEAIQGAYELLLPIVESGQKIRIVPEEDGSQDNLDSAEGFAGGQMQMRTMQLLIRTQSLICRRFEKEMGKYKYPAYHILLSCLSMPCSCQDARANGDSDSMLRSCLVTAKRAEFVRDAVELVFRTCLVSPLNAEELISESGVVVLEALLDFYVHAASCLDDKTVAGVQGASDATISEILANVIHTIAGIAFYENGRATIASLPDRSRFCINWRRCLDGKYLGARIRKAGDSLIKRFALEGVANMARSSDLQNTLIGSGIIWPLGRFLLGYDPTLDEESISRDSFEDDIGISQAASNAQARLAARALGMLCGSLQDPALFTPKNPELQFAINSILTSPVALLLRNKRTGEILRTLNTNVETPSRIWNVDMRNELFKFLDKMENERPEKQSQSVSEELKQVSGFSYSILKDELQIGGVYVRIFNQLGLEKGALREVQRPGLFAKKLTNFIAECINSSKDLPDSWSPLPMSEAQEDDHSPDLVEALLTSVSIRDRRFVLVISALRILVRVDGLIDDVLCETSANLPPVLLSLLELPQDSEAFEIGCDILSTISPKQQFADAVASHGALWRLLWVLERSDAREDADAKKQTGDHSDMLRKQRGWMLLESLSSSPSIAMKIVESTAWLELLGILVGYSGFTKIWIARIGSAKTLSRLLWDPKTGLVLAPLLQRFLPATLAVVLKEEGPETMLNLFDGESDTPELIWESSMRAELRKIIAEQLDACIEKRRESGVGNESFVLEPGVRVKYKTLEDELFVGGVYVSRFLKEPTYNVRDPTAFLEMLLQRWTHELELCTTNEGASDDKASTDLAIGGQDALQFVTNASVYLCKVRTHLCDKLCQWGYMSRCLSFLEDILAQELFGTPLLSVMRVLHVAVNRRPNVESLIVSGKNDQLHGIVTFATQAIGTVNLHPDTAFMVEMLKKLFLDALGDLESAAKMTSRQVGHAPGQNQFQSRQNAQQFYAMAPSPAPGEGPVSRNRVSMGNPLDDPLAMTATSAPANPGAMAGSGAQHLSNHTGGSMQGGNQAYQSTQTSSNVSGGSQTSRHPRQFAPAPPANQAPYQGNTFPNFGVRNQPVYPSPSVSQFQQGLSAPPTSSQFQQHSQLQPNVVHGQHPSFMRDTGAMRGLQTTSVGTQEPISVQQSHNSLQYAADTPQNSVARSSSSQQTKLQYPHQPTAPQYPQQAMSGQYSQPQQRDFQQLPQAHTTQSYGLVSPSQHIPEPGPRKQPQSWQTAPATSTAAPTPAQHTPQMQPQSIQQQQQPSQGFAQTKMSPQPQHGGPSHYQHTLGHNQWQGTSQASTPSHHVQQSHSGQLAANKEHQLSGTGAQGSEQQTEPANAPMHSAPGFGSTAGQDGLMGGSAATSQTQDYVMTSPQVGEDNGGWQSTSQMHQSQATQGAGVDARTSLDPKEEAERKTKTSPGAPGAAEGRLALLQSALVCDLPKFLVETVLESSTLPNVKDPAAVKVHAVELLKLLTTDPGYGMKFQIILDQIPSWKKYKSQDHSLFITGPEQKADYFLTDGGTGEAKKMLTQG